MSTYLKTAAMSLLSRTLQTFLSKYLSDVDVEGVALPSVYDGSGWGVRLSNVKLREGVELMKTMPGTMLKKRTKKCRGFRKQRRRRDRSKKKSNHVDDAYNDVNMPRHNEAYRGGNGGAVGGELKVDDSERSNRGRSYSSSMTPPDVPIVDEAYMSSTESLLSSGGEDDNDEFLSRPVTPVQERQSFLSCFTSRRTSASGTHTAPTAASSKEKSDRNQEIEKTTQDEHQKYFEGVSRKDESSMQRLKGRALPSVARPVSFRYDRDDEYDGDEEFDDEDDEYCKREEEEEYEQPVRLCLGADGRVGILDVRLIGKELHVMIEDADVTIEAIPILEDDDDDRNDSDTQDDHVITDYDDLDKSRRSKAEPSAGKQKGASTATTEKPKSKPKPEPKRETVGDRVLADNPLARLISSIPHLFLRDVRIRIIVRDQAITASQTQGVAESDGSRKGSSQPQTVDDCGPKLTKAKPSYKDTMVEIGIDFLSVTSGDDVLSHFHHQTEGDVEDLGIDEGLVTSKIGKPPPLLKVPSQVIPDGPDHTNEYLVRQIRTSRGPEGGFFVQLYAPTPKQHGKLFPSLNSDGDLWARQQWLLSTEHRLLRLSGLDLLARIHVGTKKVDSGYSWFYGEYVEDEDMGSDIDDSLLVFGGIDTVAPGPQLPLPPIEPRMSRGLTPRKSNAPGNDMELPATVTPATGMQKTEVDTCERSSSLNAGAVCYEVDKNGIQYCNIPSLFHRISRGMEPASCKNCKHLPSEVCHQCWQSPPDRDDVIQDSSLDLCTPMPGLVLQIGLRDPVELNIDRSSLETISILRSLFTKPPKAPTPQDSSSISDDDGSNAASMAVAAPSRKVEESSRGASATTGFFSGLFYGKSTEAVDEEEQSDAFETYMQPETISIVGIFASKINFRVHVLKPNAEDRGLAFCYWDVAIDCLTLDRQTLAASEKSFQDVKLDVGHLIWKEYRGISVKQLVSLGLPPSSREWKRLQSSVSSVMGDHENSKVTWPSTACTLLDVPSPLEILVYKSRERHGVQLRFVSLSSPRIADNVTKSQIFLKLGVTSIDSPYAVKNEINDVAAGILAYLRTQPVPNVKGNQQEVAFKSDDQKRKNARTSDDPQTKETQSSRMVFTIQVDGGQILLPPLVGIKLPTTKFSGERSSSAGLFVETLLDKLDLTFGKTEAVPNKSRPTLRLLASLPENVRMHILLCLQDLKPLEQALNLKHEKNSFRQIKSVDKGLLKAAKVLAKAESKRHHTRKSDLGSTSSNNRRQEILSEIMSLDDTELIELWTVHLRYQRKLAKKRSEGT